jgi:hypothetical protein
VKLKFITNTFPKKISLKFFQMISHPHWNRETNNM